MRKNLLPGLLVLICLNVAVFGQKRSGLPDKAAQFDTYVQAALKRWKTPGMSIAVVKDGQVLFKKGYGVAELGKPTPFTTSTLSICASTTKAMTAVCMGILVDEGKINWGDKVSDVFPALKLYDDYVNSELTIKDLFTHNAGLGNADWLWVEGTPLDSIIYKMRLIQPAYTFHSSFIYQNLMYMVAGEVIHKVSGKPWPEFITERIFTPVGMTHTYPSYEASVKEPSHITPHFLYGDTVVKPIRYIPVKGVDAAGAVWSCADDITKWMRCLLDSTKVNGTRLLKPETYELLFTPQTMVTPAEFYPTAQATRPHWTTYGLGWFQEDYHGKMVNFHTGSLDGAVAICGLINDDHFGIYIFANLDHTELRHALMYKAMDLWEFNDNSTDWSDSLYTLYKGIRDSARKRELTFENKRVLNTRPSLALKNYSGVYYDALYGNAAIAVSGDSLVLSFPNDIRVGLSHWHYDTFLGRFEYDWMAKDWLTFRFNAEGKVDGFRFLGMDYEKKE
ncbi:MAG TPA: serine hydrolase [Puia sp.]|jgi:CubicO group peptidase (beta-lactamase class C family)|nr:serine hydrolase [Puia sp.]